MKNSNQAIPPEYYNEQLKKEIIDKSDDIINNIYFYILFALVYSISATGLILLLWDSKSYGVVIMTAIGYAAAVSLYTSAKKLMSEENKEIHRLADCFRSEAARKRAHCMDELKKSYAPPIEG